MTAAEDIASLEEIRALLKALPQADEEAAEAALARQAQLTKPAGSLGRLEEMAVWLATWQGRHPPSVERPYTAVFAGNHGIAAKGVSAYPAEVTAQMVQNFIDGGAAVNQLCSLANADLRVYEMALEEPTGDISEGPAMSEIDCCHAMAYGMMAVESGIDVLALGEMGIGNTTAAAALCHGLFGGAAADWVGPGTGLDDGRLAAKVALVEQAVALHRDHLGDPLQVLCRLGGRELAAIAGAVLAARMARTPVVLDGYAATAAAAVLYALDPATLDHCLVSHVSAEPGHKRLLARIGKRAVVDLGMRLGEASGAMLAVLLLKAAVACHNGMATFAEAGVSGPDDNSL
ncbi:MAG: nicotinate-nucleotide--dimethylbenzimidazole phosphoribosyltransferase [Kiloniellaceae bacterium]